MSQITPWFERRFDFASTAQLLPNLLARLRGTPARLGELLRNQPSEILVAKPQGQWSAQENAGHLLDLETLWLSRVEDYVLSSQELTLTDLQNRKTDQANHNARPLDQLLANFRTARMQLLHRVEQIDQMDPSIHDRSIPHPRLRTPMRFVHHLYFVAEHDDHHLARIWTLLHNT